MMTTETATAEAFPVTWDDPKDAELTWLINAAHARDGMTPLGYELYFGPFLNGFGTLRACQQNYYVYNWLPDISAEAWRAITLEQLIDARRHFWESIVPEVEGHTERFLQTDFDAFSDDQLAAEIETLPAWRTRCGVLHEQAWVPYDAGMRRLIATFQELTGGDALEAVRLVQGYGNKSIDAGRALWQLGRTATSIPVVREHLLALDRDTAKECMAGLEREASARPFLEALSAFLNEFGWRTDLFELAQPTWIEDPTIPLCQMRSYLEMPRYDPDAEQQRQVAERDEAIAETMSGLSPTAAAELRDAIDGARSVLSLQEDHNFYIDQRAGFSPRRLVLAAARRVVSKGALAEANDVFYLRTADLLAALTGTTRDAQSIADRTKSEMERWKQIEPPQTIAAPPAADENTPSDGLKDHNAKELSGNGASAGVARGPARVLMSLAEADRLHPGDVLIARTTTPPWTPLFAAACAVVTENGSVLSHAAVVAREYGIPAVLGVKDATTLLKDGQLIEVDGANGTVRVVG